MSLIAQMCNTEHITLKQNPIYLIFYTMHSFVSQYFLNWSSLTECKSMVSFAAFNLNFFYFFIHFPVEVFFSVFITIAVNQYRCNNYLNHLGAIEYNHPSIIAEAEICL